MALVIAAIAALALCNLALYPATWFDEGIFLSAARTLATTGHYGLQSSEGLRAFDPGIGTGPTVIAPVALAFRIFGVGLVQGRLVAVAYTLLAALGLYVTGRQLYGHYPALIALLLFASLTDNGPFENGRWVLGEVPAITFVLWAASLEMVAHKRKKPLLFLASGLLYGLAVLTKNQLILLVPALVIGWVLRRLLAKEACSPVHGLTILIGTAIPMAAWFVFQFASLGSGGFVASLRELAVHAGVNAYSRPLHYLPSAVQFLAASGFASWGLVGGVYAALLMLRPNAYRDRNGLTLLTLVAVGLVWYATLSVGWLRYTVPFALISCLFLGKLFYDLVARYGRLAETGDRRSIQSLANDALPIGLVLMLALHIASGVGLNAYRIVRARDTTPQSFAALVETNVEAGALVEGFEWEIDFLSNAEFHHPPTQVMIDAIGVGTGSKPPSILDSYEAPIQVQYLV